MTKFFTVEKKMIGFDRGWNIKFNLRWYYSVGNISSELIPVLGLTLENLLTIFNRCRVFLTNFLSCNKKGSLGEGSNHLEEKSELIIIPKIQRYPVVSLLVNIFGASSFWLCIGPFLSPLPIKQPNLINFTTYIFWCFQMFLLFGNQKSFVQLPQPLLTTFALTEKVHSCLKFIDNWY